MLHFWWLVKADTTEPVRWAAGLTLLLGVRVWWALPQAHGEPCLAAARGRTVLTASPGECSEGFTTGC